MNNRNINRACTAEMWDRIFRSQKSYDEQTIVRFIRMVVAGEADQNVPGPRPC